MNEIDYIPVGRVHLTKSQKKDRLIKNLTFWVIIFGTADAIYTVMIVMMLIQGVFK